MKLKFNLQVADLDFSIHAADPYKVLLDNGMSGFVTESTPQNGWQIFAHPLANSPNTQNYTLVYEAKQAGGQTLWQIEANPSGHKLLRCKRADQIPLQESHLVFYNQTNKQIDIYSRAVDQQQQILEPLAYPVAPLLWHLVLQGQQAFMLHGSGIINEGKAIIFTGFSGRGKSTMAGLWQGLGHTCINDDRLLLRFQEDQWWVYNTPMYYADESKKAPLKAICAISHGQKNELILQNEFEAVQAVLPNCIQHGYNPQEIKARLNVIALLCQSIPVYNLPFVPTEAVVTLVKAHV
jgi:hypothetical protein